MKKACEALAASGKENLQAHADLESSLRSLKKIVGKPGQKAGGDRGLKKIGVALLLAPTPEPFSDMVGLALIGIGVASEHHNPPLTLCELGGEGRSILKELEKSRHGGFM
jgi:hypothetical protein